MIALAWHSLRARKTGLIGTVVALALGVALLAATLLTLVSSFAAESGVPRWFSNADVVVAGDNSVAGRNQPRDSIEALPVPRELAERLSGLGATTVTDFAGPATADGAPGETMHPWAASSLHDYSWTAGGEPNGADQIVLTDPTDYRPGDQITVHTMAGPRTFTVSGVLNTDAPPAFYTTEQVASELAAQRIDAVGLSAPVGVSTDELAAEVRRAVVDAPVRVLTGDQRRTAETDPDADRLAIAAILLVFTSTVAVFVSVFVVSSTFAYSVAARRREFGLLRAAGATPRQVRRYVIAEAMAAAVVAGLAGGVLGALLAPPFAQWLVRVGLAPEVFTARFVFWPVAVAFVVGLTVALLGAWLASRRAGRIKPAEALREAAIDRRAMTWVRWLAGLGALGLAVPQLAALPRTDPETITDILLGATLLLVIGVALLAPVLIPPLIRLLTAPLVALPGATGLVSRSSALTAVRRTAATAAPILLVVGIGTANLAGAYSLLGTEQAAVRSRIVAPFMVTPGSAAGLADSAVTALRETPGVTAAVPVTNTTVYVQTEASSADDWNGRYVNGPDVSTILSLPVVEGELTDLVGTDTVAVSEGNGHVDERKRLWLADSTHVDLRIVAVLADQIDTRNTVLLPWGLRDAHTATPLADEIYLDVRDGASLEPVQAAAEAAGGQVTPTGDYLTAANTAEVRFAELFLVAMLGMALIYTAIAIANTLVMATGDRARELATLRLSGATVRQVLRMIGVEAAMVTVIGWCLGALVTAVVLIGLKQALARSSPAVTIVIPWPPVAGIALTCLVIALLASLVPAALLQRRKPIELAGMHE